MKIQKRFGDCLDLFLSSLNLSSSRLAKAINVDASLVNRWLHGKRIPSYHSDYIESISDFLSRCILNTYQMGKIDEAIKSICDTTELWPGNADIRYKIKTILLESQGYSIETNKEQPIDASLEKMHINQTNSIKNKSSNMINFSIVGGACAIENAVKLLETAASFNNGSNSVIYICMNLAKPLYDDLKYQKYLLKAKQYMLETLRNGYNIQFLIKPNINSQTAQIILGFLQPFINTGNVFLNYYKKYGIIDSGSEVLVVPGAGVIMSLMDKSSDKGSYLVSFCSDVTAFENHMASIVSEITEPLLTLYREKNNIGYFKHLLVNKIDPGNRYLLSDMSSILLLPENILKKLVEKEKSSKKIYYIYKDYLRYIEVFKTNLNSYKCMDIYYIDSFFNLITQKKIIFHGPRGATVLDVNAKDIIALLENFVHMLENYDNYNISLINRHFFPNNFPYSYLFLKEGKSAIIGLKNVKDDSPLFVSINEPSIVNLYIEDFKKLQEHVPPFYKSKTEVIKLFKSHIEEIKTRENTLRAFNKNKKSCSEAFTPSEHDSINTI